MRLQLKWKCPSRLAGAARQCCLWDIPQLWGQGVALQGRHSLRSTALCREGVGQVNSSWVILCHCCVCEATRASSCLLILLCAMEETAFPKKGERRGTLLAPQAHTMAEANCKIKKGRTWFKSTNSKGTAALVL